MTTIATDGKTIVADGLVTSDFIDAEDAVKIWPVHDAQGVAEIFGTRGDCDLGEAYKAWVLSGYKVKLRPEFPPSEDIDTSFFEALHLHRDGSINYVCGRNFSKIKISAPAAIGSGGVLARVAMLLGKTPVEAVEFASKHDPHTGGEIICLSIEE